MKRLQSALKFCAVVVAAVGLSACVSQSLSQQDTQPQPVAYQNNNPVFDPAQREQAVAEIRDKADQPGSGELTNAYVAADGPNQPLSQAEQAAKIRELETGIATNQSNVADTELESKQRSIRQLQNQARTHYDKALNSIQN